jgi:hypothetical protein
MAAVTRDRYRVSAQDATSVTLLPVVGSTSVPDLADKISQIVITFTTARDTKFFDIVERVFEIEIEKR